MDLYPEELREPPVPVVAFIGGTKLHPAIFKNLSVVTLPDGTRRPQFHPLSLARTDSLPASSVTAGGSSISSSRLRQSLLLPLRGGSVALASSVSAAAAPNLAGAGAAAGASTSSPESSNTTFSSEANAPPQGVLKANWMWKHARVVPAVAVFLFPEWAKDHKWKAKETEFYTMLDSMRFLSSPSAPPPPVLFLYDQRRTSGSQRPHANRTHSEESSSCVIQPLMKPCSLILDCPSLCIDAADNSLKEERLANFRKKAEVDSKRIIYLYESDLSGSVGRCLCSRHDQPSYALTHSLSFRLEKMMMEQALAFYKDVAHRLKKEKEKLKNVVSHKEYYVRYCFKVGFYTEFSKDTRISTKCENSSTFACFLHHSHSGLLCPLCRHYMDGYLNLASLSPDRHRLAEIKTIAEYFHFKVPPPPTDD